MDCILSILAYSFVFLQKPFGVSAYCIPSYISFHDGITFKVDFFHFHESKECETLALDKI